MANRKVSLMWYCRTPRGWRRFPVVMGKNNRIRHTFVTDGDVEVSYPEGHYELLHYEGRKPRYRNVGAVAADAATARDKEANLLVAKDSAVAAGAKVVEEEKRVYLCRAAALYIQDTENRKAMEAAGQGRLVTEEFMEVCRKTFVDEVVKDDIYRFHRALRERGCGDRTVANKHARLKSFLKFAGVNTKSVMPPKPKYESELPTMYSQDDIRNIFKAADDYLRLALEMGLKLGLREQEIATAEWSDLDEQDSVFRVQGKKHWDFKVKDSEQRDVPVGADLMRSLKAWKKKHPNTQLILPTENGKPNTKFLRLLKRAAKDAGLNCHRCEGCKSVLGECQEWTLHKLRRTYMTTLLRNGLDLKTVQHYAGHADLASTMRYLKPATGKEAQAKINAIEWT